MEIKCVKTTGELVWKFFFIDFSSVCGQTGFMQPGFDAMLPYAKPRLRGGENRTEGFFRYGFLFSETQPMRTGTTLLVLDRNQPKNRSSKPRFQSASRIILSATFNLPQIFLSAASHEHVALSAGRKLDLF